MRCIAYTDYIAIELRPDYKAMKKTLFEVEIYDGLFVSFGKYGKQPKNPDNHYKLVDIAFDKSKYSLEDVSIFWDCYHVRLVSKKYSWNRHFELADDIIDIGNGQYIMLCFRNIGIKESLQNQVEAMFDD